MSEQAPPLSRIPSVDEVLKSPAAAQAIGRHGRPQVVEAVRASVAAAREALAAGRAVPRTEAIAEAAAARLEAESRLHSRAVFNLTGTVLHTNRTPRKTC